MVGPFKSSADSGVLNKACCFEKRKSCVFDKISIIAMP